MGPEAAQLAKIGHPGKRLRAKSDQRKVQKGRNGQSGIVRRTTSAIPCFDHESRTSQDYHRGGNVVDLRDATLVSTSGLRSRSGRSARIHGTNTIWRNHEFVPKILTAGAALAALASTTALTAPSAMAQDTAKPNILFVMTDDVGWMVPGDLPPGHDGRGDAEHRPDRQGRREVHRRLCRAELHRRTQRLHDRHESAAHRPDRAAIAGQPELAQGRHAVACQSPARSRLQHGPVRQEPSRRQRRGAADRARIPGVLGLPLPPGRDAAGQLHGRLQSEHQSAEDDRGPAVQGDLDPRRPRRSERRGPGDDDLSDPAAPSALVPLLRRHAGEPDLQG